MSQFMGSSTQRLFQAVDPTVIVKHDPKSVDLISNYRMNAPKITTWDVTLKELLALYKTEGGGESILDCLRVSRSESSSPTSSSQSSSPTSKTGGDITELMSGGDITEFMSGEDDATRTE